MEAERQSAGGTEEGRSRNFDARSGSAVHEASARITGVVEGREVKDNVCCRLVQKKNKKSMLLRA